MANFNKVILLGNLTRDPELRYTQSGMAVAKFGMAVNRKSKDKETTCFVDLVAMGRTAEVINEYCKKGRPLFIEGRLEYSQWEAKDGGGKRSKLEVVIENFQFVGGRDSGGGESGHEDPPKRRQAKAEPIYGEGDDGRFDDVPF